MRKILRMITFILIIVYHMIDRMALLTETDIKIIFIRSNYAINTTGKVTCYNLVDQIPNCGPFVIVRLRGCK